MPFYEYEAVNHDLAKSCGVCRRGFEIRRGVKREPLVKCIICKNTVRKKVSSVSVPQVTKPFSVSDAKSAGFTVLERRDSGTYEKL